MQVNSVNEGAPCGHPKEHIMGLLTALFGKKKAIKPVTKVTPRRPNNKAVQPDNTPLYLKRGWSKKGNVYQGYYRTVYGARKGRIERRGDKYNVFIFKPPIKQLRNHSRWACFYQESGDKWRINLAVNPKDRDIGAIILYVEKVIIESFCL